MGMLKVWIGRVVLGPTSALKWETRFVAALSPLLGNVLVEWSAFRHGMSSGGATPGQPKSTWTEVALPEVTLSQVSPLRRMLRLPPWKLQPLLASCWTRFLSR